MHMHACFQLSLGCLTSHEHRRSTLTQVPSQVSLCRCVEPPLSSIVSQRKRKFAHGSGAVI